MATDRQLLKQCGVGEVISLNLADPIAAVAQQHSDFYTYIKAAADGAAATTTAETDLFISVPRAGILKSVRLTPTGAAITADATNNATITVNKRDAAGANPLAVATLTTNVAGITATLAQRASAVFTNTYANVALVAGSTLTFSIAKGGTGVVVPISMLIVEIEWDGA